jgi:enterochelin esterase-like enzyme
VLISFTAVTVTTVWTHWPHELILDNLIADRKASPMIIVTPAAGVSADWRRGHREAARRFEKDLLGDLIPFAGQLPWPPIASTGAAGLSMGGGRRSASAPVTRHLSRLAVFSAGAGNNPQESLKDGGQREDGERSTQAAVDGHRHRRSGYADEATSEFLTSAGITHLQDDRGRAHLIVAAIPERSHHSCGQGRPQRTVLEV